MAYFSLLVSMNFKWLPLQSSYATSFWKLTSRKQLILLESKELDPLRCHQVGSSFSFPDPPIITHACPLFLWCHISFAVSICKQRQVGTNIDSRDQTHKKEKSPLAANQTGHSLNESAKRIAKSYIQAGKTMICLCRARKEVTFHPWVTLC